VDVYAIEPAGNRWIVIRHTEGDEMVCKWFLQEGETFVEEDLPHYIAGYSGCSHQLAWANVKQLF
jgi:hypothetical protein